MKARFEPIAAALALMFVLASCAGGKPMTKSAPPANLPYPAEIVASIGTASFVQASRLAAPEGMTEGIPAPEAMVVAESGRMLTSEELARIRELLLSPASYLPDVVRKCPFLPSFAITFVGADDKAATVYVSKACKQVRPATSASTDAAAEEIDPIADDLFALLEATFAPK